MEQASRDRKASSPSSDELIGLGAAELARRIADGAVSSRDVVRVHIDHLQSVEGQLNAMVVNRPEQAMAAAAADELQAEGAVLGPLHGVPVTVKDCFDVAGMPTTLGTPTLAKQVVEEDALIVARLKRAGAILLGKTNVSQLMVYGETDNPHFGRTSNPWDLERTPGGSSGGEAALVSVGASPLGMGSDLAGSIRVPCHFCGIHGFTPSRGLLPMQGVRRAFQGISAVANVAGPMSLHVEDIVMCLNLLKRPAAGAVFADGFQCPALRPEQVDVKKLRVAVWEDDGFFSPSPAIRRVTREAADYLADAGAQIETFQPPAISDVVTLFLSLLTGDGGANLVRFLNGDAMDPQLRQLHRAVTIPSWIRRPLRIAAKWSGSPWKAELLSALRVRSTDEYWRVTHQVEEYRRRFASQWEAGRFDVAICPPFGLPPFPHGESVDGLLASSYAFLGNLMQIPAGVIAAGAVDPLEEFDSQAHRPLNASAAELVELGSAGLPVGVQVLGPHCSDNVLLSVMQFLEQRFRQQPSYPGLSSGHLRK